MYEIESRGDINIGIKVIFGRTTKACTGFSICGVVPTISVSFSSSNDSDASGVAENKNGSLVLVVSEERMEEEVYSEYFTKGGFMMNEKFTLRRTDY